MPEGESPLWTPRRPATPPGRRLKWRAGKE